jgi:hypothetical protein
MKSLHIIAEVFCVPCTKNGKVMCIWSLTPQLEIPVTYGKTVMICVCKYRVFTKEWCGFKN